jgi:hypothetical protein
MTLSSGPIFIHSRKTKKENTLNGFRSFTYGFSEPREVSRAPVEDRRAERVKTDGFADAAKDVQAAGKERAPGIRDRMGQLPSGILTESTDIKQFRSLAKELTGADPVPPNGQSYAARVFRVSRTDFGQTEVPGCDHRVRFFKSPQKVTRVRTIRSSNATMAPNSMRSRSPRSSLEGRVRRSRLLASMASVWLSQN